MNCDPCEVTGWPLWYHVTVGCTMSETWKQAQVRAVVIFVKHPDRHIKWVTQARRKACKNEKAGKQTSRKVCK